MRQLERGRIEAVDLGRQFRIMSGGGRSLKATLLRREAPSIHEFWALRHVTVDIEPGEAFGVVGRNGSGKSTFLKMLARIYGPTEGHCAVGGRMSSLIELGAGFHPEFNAIENVYLSGAVYGIPKQELERDLADIIGFAELDEFAYQPIKTYSSGMFMRLGFSVAMHVRPDVLLLDEVLAVGDERFVQKCLGRIAQFRREGGTMLLVSHDPGTVQRICSRAMLLERGRIVDVGDATDVMRTYHEHLAHAADAPDHAQPMPASRSRFSIRGEIVSPASGTHHQFMEGEAIGIRLTVESQENVERCQVGVTLRDELGREVAGLSLDGIELPAGVERTVHLDIPDPPLRNGLFLVDASITDPLSGADLQPATIIDSFSVFAGDATTTGPVRIKGEWNVA